MHAQQSPGKARLLYLSRANVRAAGGGNSTLYMEAVTRALRLHAQGRVVQPLKPYLRWPGANHIADRLIAMPAYLGGDRPLAGIKWVGSRHHNPREHGLERASALTILNDAETNYPVAILEGALISGMRTAAVTAVAARYLAREHFGRVTVLGCGPIGRMHVQTLLEQFPAITCVHLFDLDPGAARGLAAEVAQQFATVEYRMAASAAEAVRGGELVVSCTVTNEPYIPFDWLGPGTLVSNVSIMDLAKEVFLRADKVVVDDWEQANREEKIIHQLAVEGRFSRDQLHAELGEVVMGLRPGRETDEEIIVLNPMGLAIHDVACAQALYQRALDAGIGTWLELG